MRRCDPRVAVRATALLAVAALTGCTVAGTPEPARVDLSALDFGTYQHVPLVAPDGDDYSGRVLESVRIGEVMINPAKADAALSLPADSKPTVPLPTPAKVSGVLSEQARAVLDKYGMVAGFQVAGTDSVRTRGLSLLALRMPDSDAATKAAADLDATDAAVSPDNVAVTIPNYAAARAHWRPTVASMAATVARGSFVVSVLVTHPTPDAAALIALIGKAFDAQLPELDRFVATPIDQLASLPLDGEKMLTRLIPEKLGRWSRPAVLLIDREQIAGGKTLLHASGVVYGPNVSYLNGTRQQRSAADAFAMIGFDGLMRYPDAVEARRAFDRGTRSLAADGLRTVAGPAGLADIECLDDDAGQPAVRYACRVLHGRYIATVFAPQEQQAKQKAAAQYSLLVLAG
ncbi:hypothetical protein GCM10011610_52120 [Nocardia rhizosphaerihabitans]|uniref:Uncharacterized protein n=1 Tax=Nocardia rhizosphaerihabitans TaxID=1691570 RepID=A0ABQ2KSD8_9NOCA|nr:hypothetical protein GCM10011610_52120 [Nocardia rhizosphaerihabitans]